MNDEDKCKPQTVEDVKTLLGDQSTLLDFEDREDAIIAKIKQYIGNQTFTRLATSIQQLGGRYVSEPERWRFIIPKKTSQTPNLPDLTQVPHGTMLKVPVTIIQKGKFWVRKHLDPNEMSKLRESIRRNGDVTYPLATYPVGSSKLELLGGHRRLQACKESGILYVSVRVFHPQTEEEKWELALQDEMHEPWSPIAKARAYLRMREEEISIEEITLIAGEPYETVKKHLALNDLPEHVQQLIDARELGISFGLSLLKLKDKPQQCISLAKKAADNAWTRQKLENEISKIQASFAETDDFQRLPVTQGKSFFPEKKPFPRGTGSPTEKPEIQKEAQTNGFSTAVSEPPQPSFAQEPSKPVKQEEGERDAAWDLALKHYPISLVDFVWERVTVQGHRLSCLKTLCQAEHELIVEHNLLEKAWETARTRVENQKLRQHPSYP